MMDRFEIAPMTLPPDRLADVITIMLRTR